LATPDAGFAFAIERARAARFLLTCEYCIKILMKRHGLGATAAPEIKTARGAARGFICFVERRCGRRAGATRGGVQ
jgi:hypothetical protein